MHSSAIMRVPPDTYSFESQSLGLEGVINARELGGYELPDGSHVKKGKLLRGGCLQLVTRNDVDKLSGELKVCQIFDFRTEMETRHFPDADIPGASRLWLPTIDERTEKPGETSLPHEAYADLAKYLLMHSSEKFVQEVAHNLYPSLVTNEYTQLQYAAFLQIIANHPGDTFYWHCSQGKDRTGLGAAFLLAALGADRELILADYNISADYYHDEVWALGAQVLRLGGGEDELKVIRTFIGVNTEYFVETLDIIENQYGGMEAYLRNQLCLTDADRAALKAKFLE